MPSFGYSKWGRDACNVPVPNNVSQKDIALCNCSCCPGVNFLRMANWDLCDAFNVQLKHYKTREHEINRIRVIEGRTPPTCYICPNYNYDMTDREWDTHCETLTHKILCNRASDRVIKCEICNYELADEAHRKEHNESKLHMSKVRPAYHCNACDFTTKNPTHWDRHRNTKKCPLPKPTWTKPHQKETNFHCKTCNFYAPNSNKLTRHFGSAKHRLRILEKN